MIGRTIGKYRIVDQLGRGGMGTVYKAVDESLGRDVAIKVLNADVIEPDSIERFRREALILARLNHPRIAAIHDLSRDGHDLLMVMELLSGENCEKLIERRGALPVPDAVRICSQVLDALQYAHRAGVVHRDLKPANIIVAPSGDIKVMDFGIARVQGSEHLTTHGFMVGTPAYMAPEQVRGEEVDPRMDIYAVAVVLYRLLTRRLPFQGETAVTMIHSQLTSPPTPPREFRADLPDWIEAIILRGLAKAPADRFQTAGEFRAALEAGLTGRAGRAIPGDLEETIGPTPTPLPAQAPDGPAPVTVPAPHSPSDTVTLRTPHLATAGVVLATLVIGIGVVAFVALRPRDLSTTTAPSSSTSAGPAVTPPVSAAGPADASPMGAPPNSGSGTAVPGGQPPAVNPPASAPGTPVPPTPTRQPAAPGAAAAGSARPPRPSSPPAAPSARPEAVTPAPVVESAIPASTPEPKAPAFTAETFADVRYLVVEGDKSRELQVSLRLEPERLEVRAPWNDTVLRAIPYQAVAAATYVRGRRPRGRQADGLFPMPGNVGSGGLFGGSRHWITLQTPGEFLILRLEDRNVVRVLMQIEARSGKKVERER